MAHAKQPMLNGASSCAGSTEPAFVFSTVAIIRPLKPRLRDAKLKRYTLRDCDIDLLSIRGMMVIKARDVKRLQEALDERMSDIGSGDFNVDSFSEIADPEERFWEMHSLLDLPAGD
jgi:hypothetical protein